MKGVMMVRGWVGGGGRDDVRMGGWEGRGEDRWVGGMR